MILGIGTDIIEVARVQQAVSKEAVKRKVFSEREIAYCSQDATGQSYAARAAAKEAFLKALGTGWRNRIHLHEVEILNDELGKPLIALSGETRQVFEERGGGHIQVSLSHIKTHALAFVIIEK